MTNKISFGFIIASSILIGSTISSAASPRIDIGFEAGTMKPDSETVGRDALFKLGLGIYEPASGFEFRGNIGFFSNISTAPDLVGSDFRMDITPLTASVFYHFGTPESFLQPYVGGGVGGYFYKVSNYEFGQLESGTKFAPHLSAGLKFNLSDHFFISTEYTHTFLGRTFFDKPDFNLSALTIGFGFKLEPSFGSKTVEAPRRVVVSDTAPNLLASQSDDIQQLVEEIKKMTDARDKLEARVDAFYENTDIEVRTGFITAKTKGLVLNGTAMVVTDPTSDNPIVTGVIEQINETPTEWLVTLKNSDGWQIPITVGKVSAYVTVGNRPVSGITQDNINSAVAVTTVSSDVDAAKELRKIRYYEEKLKVIDQKITTAKTELSKLRQSSKVAQASVTPIATQTTTTTVIIDDRYPDYYTPRYYDPYRYRYYSPIDYAPPTYVPSTPTTPEERAEYVQKKRDHILKLKSRK